MNDSNKECSALVTSTDQHCICEKNFTLEEDFKGTVYMYYGLTNFYQNHRRYVKSRDDIQLLGNLNPSQVASECEPYHENAEKIPVAPCGAIANSMFSDVLTIIRKFDNGSMNDVPLRRKGIAWPSDKKTKFNNPVIPAGKTLKDAFRGFAKPRNWTKNIYELDTDLDNNGFLNEDLIVWMRTAALPNFRKLYRIINNEEEHYKLGLPKGDYVLRVDYCKSKYRCLG